MINNYVEYEYQACHLIHPFDQDRKYALYLGDVSSALDLDFIHHSNIKTVVTAAASMGQVAYQPQDQLKHIVYSVLDHKNQNLIKYFDQFYELVQKQIKNGSILVHCAAGISRSSTLVISYLMKKNTWTFKQAIKYVRNSRPNVLPNLGFQRQLKQYEKIILQQENRRLKSKTSQSNKHVEHRIDILPEIGFIGGHIKNKVLQGFRIYKREDENDKINQRNFLFNNHILKSQNKAISLKYQQISKSKPQSRQFGQTKSVSLQQRIQKNIRNIEDSTKFTSYADIKTDQTEIISSRIPNPVRSGLFDSAIIPIKYNTASKPTDKLKKTNIKFTQLNGNMITINKMNIFKQKYTKNSPTLSLGKVGLNDLIDGLKNDIESNNVGELKTRLNFPIKLSKVKESQSEVNYPAAAARKDLNGMKKDLWPLKKQGQIKNDDNKFDDQRSRKINIKNLLFYNND